MPENANSAEAKELLGVARERRGPLAHAKAEYEEYLKWYPGGEGAQRVRQRLDALLTASSKPPDTRSGATTRPSEFELFGSASTQYRREVLDSDATGSMITDSSLFSDLSVSSRAATLWRALAAGSCRFDFVEERTTRISALRRRAAPGLLGPSDASPATPQGHSRFDGVRLNRRSRAMRESRAGGFPVEIQTSRVETDRYLYASPRRRGSGGRRRSAVRAAAAGRRMLAATAWRARYADDRLFVASYVDYDIYFGDLNTALLSGNWQIGPTTSATLFVDYRNSPILATWNAIQGQGVDNLDELTDLYSDSEIKQLAQDRTPRSTLVSLGGSQQLTDRLQLALDVSASYLSDTPASGGVEAMATRVGVLTTRSSSSRAVHERDVGTIGIRYFDGNLSDTWSLIINERYPITPLLRVLPRVRVDWRNRRGRDEFLPDPDASAEDPIAAAQAARARNGSLTVRPYLGIEWRVWKLTLFGDAGLEWTSGSFDAGGGDEFAYAFSGGLRYDF
jgi:hypothetical protein